MLSTGVPVCVKFSSPINYGIFISCFSSRAHSLVQIYSGFGTCAKAVCELNKRRLSDQLFFFSLKKEKIWIQETIDLTA